MTTSQVLRSEQIPTTERWTQHEELLARTLPTGDWLELHGTVRAIQAIAPYGPLSTSAERDPEWRHEQGSMEALTKDQHANALVILMRLANEGTHPTIGPRLRRAMGS
ncbi:MAG: hypothetical protein JWR35_3822 [Marmoricola sp.]|nr:hypothetical protein [Marmoricola sp.]